jgi:hypothetical protein
MASLAFPDPARDDPATVTSALQMGKRDWDRAEFTDAVRWIRKAADAAEASGDDARALELARLAADLMSSLEGASQGDEAAALAPFDDFNDQTLVDAPAVSLARQASQGPVSIENRATPITPPAWSGTPATSVRARTTLRVAVGLVAPGGGSLKVTVLPDGSDAPAGTTEALLVLLDPDARVPVRLERA